MRKHKTIRYLSILLTAALLLNGNFVFASDTVSDESVFDIPDETVTETAISEMDDAVWEEGVSNGEDLGIEDVPEAEVDAEEYDWEEAEYVHEDEIGLPDYPADTVTYPVAYTGTKCESDAQSAFAILNTERRASNLSALTLDAEYQETAMERARQLSIVHDYRVPDPAQNTHEWGLPACEELEYMGSPNDSVATLCDKLFISNAQGRSSILESRLKVAGIGVYRNEYVSVIVVHLSQKAPTTSATIPQTDTVNVSSSYFGVAGYNEAGEGGSFITVDTYPEAETLTIYGRVWTPLESPIKLYTLDASLYTLEVEAGSEQYFSITQSGAVCTIQPKNPGTGYILAKLKANPGVEPKGGAAISVPWNRIGVRVKERSLSDRKSTCLSFDNTKQYLYHEGGVRPDDLTVTYYNQNTDKTSTLVEGVDFQVSGLGETDSTRNQVTIDGIGIYQGTFRSGNGALPGSTKYYDIVKPMDISLSPQSFEIYGDTVVYTGQDALSDLRFDFLGKTLTLGEDYTLRPDTPAINAGTYSYTVCGINWYKGEKPVTLTITPASIKNLSVANGTASYTGKDIPVTLNVVWNGKTLKAGTDYTVSPATVKNSGTTKITVTGKGNFKDSTSTNFVVSANTTPTPTVITPTPSVVTPIPDAERIDIHSCSVAGISLSYGYSGKAYTPETTVKLNGETLTKGVDYTIEFANNQNPGTATATLTGIGKYKGTKVRTFQIVDCVSQLVSGRTYQLIPKNNSATAVCSFSGRMVNNTKVYITDRSASEAMRFKAVKNADGTWKFINAKCELALAVQQNSKELGKGIVLYDQTTKPAQNWKLEKKSDNSFAIMNAVTGYSIAMSDESAVKGTTLSMAQTQSNGLQRFYIVETNAVNAPYSKTVSLRASANTKYCVNVSGASVSDGANINLNTYSDTNSKKFKLLYSGGGYYRLINVYSGLALTVEGNTKTNGANVVQSKWDALSGQRWKVTPNTDGTYTLTNVLGTNLHLVSNKTSAGTNISAKVSSTSKAQKWYMQ